MDLYLLDTNVVSRAIRGREGVLAEIAKVRRAGGKLILSPVVEFEVRRGLLRRDTAGHFVTFGRLVQELEYREFDRNVWWRTATLWEHCRRTGETVEDTDLLIAAHTLELDAVLVTDNEKHFRVFEPLGLRFENWITTT